jgi:hypothetical protein
MARRAAHQVFATAVETPRRKFYTKTRSSCFREGAAMKNVTISMDDDLASRTRVAAAKAGKSVSKYLAEAAREKVEADDSAVAATKRNLQKEALERILSGPKWSVMENGRMPTAEERNARR